MAKDDKVEAPSAQELLAALNRANDTIAAQGRLIEELRAGAPAARPKPQPAPQARPYKWLVRAKAACWIGHLRSEGEIFHHEARCLWSDDPFEPVIVTQTLSDGTEIWERHPSAPEPLPFHLRARSHEALAADESVPKSAAEWMGGNPAPVTVDAPESPSTSAPPAE